MEAEDFNVETDEDGRKIVMIFFQWKDAKGEKHNVTSHDLDEALTVLELLSGEICFADLEP